MAITAVIALGVGVTGTLLWMENRPTAPASASATGAPASASLTDSQPITGTEAGQNDSHEPPAELTRGMSPPEAALALGNWNYDHEKWDEAIANYRRALKSGVDNPNIRTDLGNALRFSNKPQEALAQYRFAQKQDPTHEPSLFNQGALFAQTLKNPRKGVEAWRAYLKRFPTGSSAAKAREFIAQYESAAKK